MFTMIYNVAHSPEEKYDKTLHAKVTKWKKKNYPITKLSEINTVFQAIREEFSKLDVGYRATMRAFGVDTLTKEELAKAEDILSKTANMRLELVQDVNRNTGELLKSWSVRKKRTATDIS